MIKSAYTVIKTKKLEETAKFYEEYFGFTRSYSSSWYISLQSGDSQLAILDPNHDSIPLPFRGQETSKEILLNIELDNVDEVYEKFQKDYKKIHLDLKDEPWGQRHFISEDPNGIPLDVIKMIPPSEEFLNNYA